MGLLSSNDVLRLMDEGKISVSPWNLANLRTNSLDVRLDTMFVYVASLEGEVQYFGPLIVQLGQKVWVPAGGTLLGRTVEQIGTRHDIVAGMRSRSTTRRKGLTVCCDAGLGDIGYANHWTCEFSAHLNDGIYIKTGERFAQMTFDRTETPPVSEYAGQYNVQDWPLCMVPEEYRDKIMPLWMLHMVSGFEDVKLVKDD